AIRRNRTAILVEGYMDVIGIHSKEIENVVAPLGTALTEFQVRTIKNYADRLIIMLDGDKAGRAAALRASEICLKENLSSAVVLLENGTDPYDLSRTASKQEILPLFENAISSADFMIRESIQGAVPTSPPDIKRKAVQNLFALVKGMHRDTDRQSYLEEGARKRVPEKYLLLLSVVKEKLSQC
ncbi:MAG: toprim domain-containing protein, partial [Leptospira sp.]|nr:toprim domain-containing protein [Leptospira sp.]